MSAMMMLAIAALLDEPLQVVQKPDLSSRARE
jgi:hypothetical protein